MGRLEDDACVDVARGHTHSPFEPSCENSGFFRIRGGELDPFGGGISSSGEEADTHEEEFAVGHFRWGEFLGYSFL